MDRTYKSEFPTYDEELPGLGPMVDESWHNDVCPNFIFRKPDDPDLGLCTVRLWVDYRDPERREISGRDRFLLEVLKGEDWVIDNQAITVLEAETFFELREKCNDWYQQNVGYRPDYETGPLEIGELLVLVGQSAYLHKFGSIADQQEKSNLESKPDLRKTWTDLVTPKLVGRTVTQVRYMTEEEQENMGWHGSCLAIFFDDGSFIFPSQDDEGNGPGALFTSWEDLNVIPVIS